MKNLTESLRVGMGAEAVKELLQSIDVEKLKIKAELFRATGQKRRLRLLRDLKCLRHLEAQSKPEWMIMDVIPVIPQISDLCFS